MSWADRADQVLAEVFRDGIPPKTVIRDAYPFGPRSHHPYKVWLRRVRAWRHARSMGMASPFSLKGVGLKALSTQDLRLL
jgi:hypothetical protein